MAVPDGNGWRKFTGNELGVLLLDYILKKRTEAKNLPTGAEAIRRHRLDPHGRPGRRLLWLPDEGSADRL